MVGGIMLYSLATCLPLDLNVMHDRNPLLVKLSNGDIRNGYERHILNKTHEDRTYSLEIDGIKSNKIVLKNTHEINMNDIPVFAESVGHFRFF